jgi:hypothetical protein
MKKLLFLMLLPSIALALDPPNLLYNYKGELNKLNLTSTIQDTYVRLGNTVNTSGAQAIAGDKTFTGSVTIASATVTNLNYNNLFVGVFTRNFTSASGDVSYTGVGFTPKMITFYGAINGNTEGMMSYGFCTNIASYVSAQNAVNTKLVFTDRVIHFAGSGTDVQLAVLKSFDSDGFTLTWTKGGTPTGTITFIYTAQR